jgi:hypothetical protein
MHYEFPGAQVPPQIGIGCGTGAKRENTGKNYEDERPAES